MQEAVCLLGLAQNRGGPDTAQPLLDRFLDGSWHKLAATGSYMAGQRTAGRYYSGAIRTVGCVGKRGTRV